MELEEAKLSLENRWKNINQPLPDAIDKITCELFGDEQYKALSLTRQKEEEREKEALTRDLFKHWKDTSLPLPDEIKEITLKSLGEKQHNMLSLLRQYILLSELDNSRFIAVDGLAFDVETGLMWLRFAYGQTWQDGTAKGEAKVIRNGEQSPYKKRDAKVIWDKDKEIEIDYFNGKFKRAEARRLSKKLEGYEGENYEFEICFEQDNYFLGEEMVLEWGEKRERGYAGFYDWRIPTVEESKTLVTNTNSDVFPDSSFVEGTDTCLRLVRGQQNSILPTSKADIFDEEIIASLIFLNAIDIYEKNKNQKLVRKYRTNSAGIRNDGKARKLCLKCGSSDNIEYSYFHEKCKTCGTSWYVNHCWKCKKMVDERDSETPRCKTCDWCKCTCGACKQGCTSK